MAKRVTVKLHELMYEESPEISTLFFESGTRTKAVLSDFESGHGVIFEGSNFKYSDGKIVSGTVDKMTLVNDEGKPMQSFSNLDLNAGFVFGDDMLDFTQYVYYWATAGNIKLVGTDLADEISTMTGKVILLGRGGDDYLSGSLGNDKLTGGKGFDTFQFGEGFGKDIITDFDAVGGEGAQDFIAADFAAVVSIEKSGKDTVIDFGEGDTLTLLGVKASDVTEDDFALL